MKIGIPPLSMSIDMQGRLGPELLSAEDPAVIDAFRKASLLAGEFVRGVWLQVAGAMDIRGGGTGTTYLQGIRAATVEIESETFARGALEIVVVVRNTAPHAAFVEDGHAAFHLPSRINWSGPRVKQGKNGPFLHIPFRSRVYASPGQADAQGLTAATRRQMMPADVTNEARKLTATIRHNAGPQYKAVPDGKGGTRQQFIAADRYTWGQRLQRGHVPTGFQVGPSGQAVEERRGARSAGRGRTNPEWQSSRWEGLFRTQQAGGGSTYMTIRTITPRSLGWHIPAQSGRGVARRVMSGLRSGIGSDELHRIVGLPFAAAMRLELDRG